LGGQAASSLQTASSAFCRRLHSRRSDSLLNEVDHEATHPRHKLKRIQNTPDEMTDAPSTVVECPLLEVYRTRYAQDEFFAFCDPKQTSLLRSKDAPLDHVIRVAAGAILGINSGQPIAPAAACQSELFVGRIHNWPQSRHALKPGLEKPSTCSRL